MPCWLFAIYTLMRCRLRDALIHWNILYPNTIHWRSTNYAY
jgi:hypothetical protein